MTDVLIKNGDIALDSSGRTVMLRDADAKFQRALICIRAKKGAFIYDRSLGSGLADMLSGENGSAEKAELEINEALARLENTFARVTNYGENVTVELTVDGETRVMEVF